MKKITDKPIIWLFFSLQILIGCSHQKEEQKNYRLSDELKSWIMFPEGSYWVYKDHYSGKIDTVTLKTNTIQILLNDEYNYSFETLYTRYGITDDTTDNGGQTWYEESKNYFYYFGFPGSFCERPPGNGFLYGQCDAFIDSMKIEGVTYYNIREFSINNKKHDFLWAKNIGIIYRKLIDINDSVEWNLIDYKLQ